MTHRARGSVDIRPGHWRELGAIPDGDGTNFALFSAAAERVELCLFADDGTEQARIDLPEYTNEIWHGYLPGVGPGQLYGYRVHGPYDPEAGYRFNPNKLLIDPYARRLHGEIRWDPAVYGYDLAAEEDPDLTFEATDSAPFMPKSVVTDLAADRDRPSAPGTRWDRTVIYEAHVRGFTMGHPDVPDDVRGTFAGMGHRAVVDHVRSLGVTTVELLPIHAFTDDHVLVDRGLRNFWGYNTLAFFAPEQRYLGGANLTSVRDMVRSFHDAGIEVILDVVYNHSAEGNERGATLSFRGIDNRSYYRLMPEEPRYYINDTGTGNTINTSHPRVLHLVMDSLRYWAEVMEVDGFRFDLGTVLGREPHGFDQRSGFFDAVGQDPVLRRLKLVGEPWDIGPGGYQVGGFPPGWAEWNDKYRDVVRAFWRGDHGLMREFAARITGSGDVYDFSGRRPWASVNFIAAHDGYTLNDLVTYEEKHNEANGEGNRDGHSDNRSCNYGVEGPTDDPRIRAIRFRQRRNLLATLLVSHGTPMILAGDEFGHTQGGNNNVYCQDNPLGWIDWDAIDDDDRAVTAFVQRLLALRAEHPIFRRASYRDGTIVDWFNASGGPQTPEQWDDPTALTIGLRLRLADDRKEIDEALILFNAYHLAVPFRLPERDGGRGWSVVLATDDDVTEGEESFTGAFDLTGRSIVVLA
jgi:glycogen operon protein